MRVAVVTAGRSDRGLLDILIAEMRKHPEFGITIVATGESTDGDIVVDMLLSSDSDAGIAASVGLGIIRTADAYRQSKPDVVVLLGDRFEILAAAVAAYYMRIPVAHLHGGERTRGSLDDAARDCITMLASYHFVCHETYAMTVAGMAGGIVQNVGALALDALPEPGCAPDGIIVSIPSGADVAEAVAEALRRFPGETVYWFGPNADAGRRSMPGLRYAADMSRPDFLALLARARVIVGNSSCGIIEASAVGTPTVNVGNRQKGRVRPSSVIDVPVDPDAIIAAIEKALTMRVIPHSPFGDGHAAERITEVLLNADTRRDTSSSGLQAAPA